MILSHKARISLGTKGRQHPRMPVPHALHSVARCCDSKETRFQDARLAGYKCIPRDQGLPGRRQPQGFPLGVHPLTSCGKLGWMDGCSQRLPPITWQSSRRCQ